MVGFHWFERSTVVISLISICLTWNKRNIRREGQMGSVTVISTDRRRPKRGFKFHFQCSAEIPDSWKLRKSERREELDENLSSRSPASGTRKSRSCLQLALSFMGQRTSFLVFIKPVQSSNCRDRVYRMRRLDLADSLYWKPVVFWVIIGSF